ncbi:response regulator [Phormidium tenue FACHB-886]|nr:response regulator [Phormidium tenue FACHB-886]
MKSIRFPTRLFSELSISKLSNRASLRTILIIPFALQISAAVGLVGYLSFRNGQQAVQDLAGQLQKEAGNRIVAHLESYLNIPHQLNFTNVDAIATGNLQLSDSIRTGRYFWRQLNVFGVRYINFGGVNGDFIGAGLYPDGYNIEIINQSTKGALHTYETDDEGNPAEIEEILKPGEYDPREFAWYKDPIEAKKPVWSEIYLWEDYPEFISISASVPVYSENESLLGALGVDLLLTDISDFLSQLEISDSGKVFIVERDGLLVASSSADQPLTLVDNEAQRIAATASPDPLVQAASRQLMKQFGDLNQIEEAQKLEFTFDDAPQFVQVTPWQDQYGLDWLIVTVVPESDFMEQINANTRTTILLCLTALAVATLIGIFTAQSITRPILQLNSAAKDIAQGNWDNTVRLERTDEVGELALSFNSMAQQLKDSFETLEQRVEERTAELVESNKQLEVAKEKAEIASQTKSEFLANVSHELRTPLNGILGYAQVLRRDYPKPTNASQVRLRSRQILGLRIIEQSGTHLLTLINDILDSAKIEARKMELYPSEFDFRAFLQEIIGVVHTRAEAKGLALHFRSHDTLPTYVCADEKRLRQVLLNLLGNAVKFTEQGHVTLHVSAEEQASISLGAAFLQYLLRFEVIDTGAGISSEHLETIFRPFEQVGSAESRLTGTGLGLALSQQIVELMGGQLQVKSEVGQGSTFWFTVILPGSGAVESVADDVSGTVAQVIGYQGARRKILVIDDNEANRLVLLHMLEPIGFEVMLAEDGMQALEAATKGRPDLILTDVFMPVKTAITLIPALRQIPELLATPIVATSANHHELLQQQCLKLGCAAFLPKPIDLEQLLTVLQEQLRLEWMHEDTVTSEFLT